ncbi:unnamed protein product [Pleuronectes platessa]|uniref:Uncharacterized protein n=1 Tax=Pleuronectes platessa TaxID=8262 RepID=A0A9N7UHZ5_PLEPL|nr:unnamed protein product [Pleuronectes platessa]
MTRGRGGARTKRKRRDKGAAGRYVPRPRSDGSGNVRRYSRKRPGGKKLDAAEKMELTDGGVLVSPQHSSEVASELHFRHHLRSLDQSIAFTWMTRERLRELQVDARWRLAPGKLKVHDQAGVLKGIEHASADL